MCKGYWVPSTSNGRSFGRGAYNAWLKEAGGARTIQAIISSARRSSSKQCHPKETIPGNIASHEINNHVDTACASPNWRLIELSGKYCTVSPFSAEYQPKHDVPIAKFATNIYMPSNWQFCCPGRDQVLWFGNDLHCSLINPHQLRAYGYGVYDDPWDPHRPIGFELESLSVPLNV